MKRNILCNTTNSDEINDEFQMKKKQDAQNIFFLKNNCSFLQCNKFEQIISQKFLLFKKFLRFILIRL